MTNKNRLHHTIKEEGTIHNLEREMVKSAIKNYQKETIIQSLHNKDSHKKQEYINEYQEEYSSDDSIAKGYDLRKDNWRKNIYIRSGHKYQSKKQMEGNKNKENEPNIEDLDHKEQHFNDESQEEKTKPSETDKEVEKTVSDNDVFTNTESSAENSKQGKQRQILEDNKVYQKGKKDTSNKSANQTVSKKRVYPISKAQKKKLLEKAKTKRTGDGSIDKDNEANAVLDTVHKVNDLKTEVPQTIKSIKDDTISAATGTVRIIYQTGSDIKEAVSDAKVFAKKVNGLIEHRQYVGVHQAKKRDTRNVYETNRTYQDKVRNTKQEAKNNSRKASKDKKNNPSEEKDKKNHGLLQDMRRSAMRFATKPYAEQENNMSTGVSNFAKEQTEKYAQSKIREAFAKVGKTVAMYTGKFIVMLLKFAITMIIQAITFLLSLTPFLLLPILIMVVLVGLFSYFFGGADVSSTDTNYLSMKLNAKYDEFEDTISKWERNNKQGVSGYTVVYEGDCFDIENFNDVLTMYIVYSVEAQATQKDYLLIDTDEENERLDRAFELFNNTYTTDDEKTLHVSKKTYEEVDDLLNDTQKDYYTLALEAFAIGTEEGYVIDKRVVREKGAEKALENSPQGTLPMSYEELKKVFTWMNEDNVYPIDDGGMRYVTSQYTLARTDVDENHTTHYGVDFTSEQGIGANLVSIAKATVYKIVSAQNDTTGYGNHVIVRFDDGTYALYAHMNDFIIKNGTDAEYDKDGYEIRPSTNEEYLQEGDQLNAGDLIGHMGNTGDSFGAHVHLVLSTDAYGSGEGSRYDFNDYVACVWVKDFDYSYDY